MKIIIILFLIVAGIAFGGWVWNSRNTTSTVPLKLEKVNLKLKWLHQAQFAGNYVAIEKKIYHNLGLDVSVQPFSYENTSIKSILSGESDFGIAGAEEVVIARSKGQPIKAIAVIYKINPVTAYTLKSSRINSPKDFVGKTVGIERGINVEYLYEAMMGGLKIDRKKIKEISIGHDAKELLDGTVDVSTGYIINEPHLAMEAGKEIKTILMADYGVNMYADVIVTTDDTIKNKPELVENFLKGTLQGWQYAIEHENEAVEMTMKYAKDSTVSHQQYMLLNSIPLINTGSSKLGWMTESEWSRVQNILYQQKIITQKIDVSSAYTMDFLEKIYK